MKVQTTLGILVILHLQFIIKLQCCNIFANYNVHHCTAVTARDDSCPLTVCLIAESHITNWTAVGYG